MPFERWVLGPPPTHKRRGRPPGTTVTPATTASSLLQRILRVVADSVRRGEHELTHRQFMLRCGLVSTRHTRAYLSSYLSRATRRGWIRKVRYGVYAAIKEPPHAQR